MNNATTQIKRTDGTVVMDSEARLPHAAHSRPKAGEDGGRETATSSEGDGPSAPRYVTRGADSHPPELALGWLRGSFPIESFEMVLSWAASWLGTPTSRNGIWRYHARYAFPVGGFIAYDPDHIESRADHFTLELPAGVFETLPPDEVYEVCKLLRDMGIRVSRLDASYDDWDKIVDPMTVYLAAKEGNCAGYRVHGFTGKRIVGGASLGDTADFGVRGKDGGGRYGRVYDKAAESDGMIDAIRWEVEFADDHAKAAFATLCQSADEEEFIGVLGTLVGGAFDFPDRSSGDPNLDRLPRLDWWVSIRERIGSCRITVQREASTMEARLAWVTRCLAKPLAMIRRFLEATKREGGWHPWLVELLHDGRHRLTLDEERRLQREIDACLIPV